MTLMLFRELPRRMHLEQQEFHIRLQEFMV